MVPEIIFGSVPQVWSPFPYGQAGIRPLTNPATGQTMQGPILANSGVGTPATMASVPAFNPGVPGMTSAISALPMAGFELAGSVSVPALLATVAVRRGQPLGPTNDQEIEEFIGDALDLLPGSSDIEVRCEGGRVILTGQVSQKRLKREAGEVAWFTPRVNDVQNNVTIVARRRSRSSRETETAASRKA
jgi:hypothetical protein